MSARRGKQYSSEHLKGIKIAHDVNDFKEGESIILTLKDAPIIKGDVINEDEDELENVHMTEADRFLKAKQAAKKGYDVYSELEVGDEMDVLKKYDEVKNKQGFRLQGAVTSSLSNEEMLSQVRNRLQKMKAPAAPAAVAEKMQYTLSDPLLKPVSEYTPIKLKKKRRNRSVRQQVATEELNSIKKEEAEEDQTEDHHGSRDTTQNVQLSTIDLKKKQTKAKAYENAIQKAKIKSMALMDEEGGALEDDNALYESLKTRRVAPKRTFSVAERVKQAQQHKQQQQHSDPAAVTFTSTSEFCRTLEITQNTETDASEPPIKVKTEKMEEEPTHKDDHDTNMESEQPPLKKEKKQHVQIIEEPLVSTGMAATLRLIQQTGDSMNDYTDLYAGRRNDIKAMALSEEHDVAPSIKLEHRDEYGRLLTHREAFRTMSQKFHNKLPGINKRAKNKKKYEEELKLRHMSSDDTPLNSVQRLHQEQQRLGEAYIDLSAPATVSPSSVIHAATDAFTSGSSSNSTSSFSQLSTSSSGQIPTNVGQKNIPRQQFEGMYPGQSIANAPKNLTQLNSSGKIEFNFTGLKRKRS